MSCGFVADVFTNTVPMPNGLRIFWLVILYHYLRAYGAWDHSVLPKRNHVVTDKAKIERAAHFFRHARTAHIGT
ncbi:MAG TPA: hypothetical protein VE242_10525, partial [Chthoniobacterales bacterium]|nr:hypothetical protein [Chthoniobacterales bacterium]